MIFNARKCDNCAKVTNDEIKDGWIVLGDGGFKKYKGRSKDGQGITEVFVAEGADFCSWVCLKQRTGYKKPIPAGKSPVSKNA